MEDNNNRYTIPEGFNPCTCMDTIRGLTDAIHHHMTEGPSTERNPSRGDQGGLISLIDLLQLHVHELHAWFIETENSTSLELPITDADFEALRGKLGGKDEVRETAVVYAIR